MKFCRISLLFMVLFISWMVKAQTGQAQETTSSGFGLEAKIYNVDSSGFKTKGIVAVADKAKMNENGMAFIEVLANDIGLDEKGIVVTITGAPTHGTAIVNIDNTITYTPQENYNGTDTITYQICNAKNECSSAIATVTINPVKEKPIINSSAITQTVK